MNWCRSRGIASVGLLLACSDGTGPDPDRICSTPVSVTVSRSTTPVVSWAPGCRVNQVVIHEPGPQFSLAWATFFRADSNLMVPPVRYGIMPTGAQQLPDNPQALTVGTTYIIDVAVSDSSAAGGLVFVGSDTITP